MKITSNGTTTLVESSTANRHEHRGVIRAARDYDTTGSISGNVVRSKEQTEPSVFLLQLNMPHVRSGSSYVDWTSRSSPGRWRHSYMDTDEFEQNAMRYGYSEELRRKSPRLDTFYDDRHRQVTFDS